MLHLKFFKNTYANLSSYFLLGLILMAIVVPVFSSVDPNAFDPNQIAEPEAPSLTHWFGTDDLGRDLFIRCVVGARVSLMVGFISVGISILIGIMIGLTAGYWGRWIDEIFMRFIDLFMAVPSIFLILAIQVLLTPSIYNVMVVIGLTSWMGVARMIRAEVLRIKSEPFVTACRARGIFGLRLVCKHMLPHTLQPIIVSAMLGMGAAILTESVLSYLGLGVQPPHASWGNMLENSLSYMGDAPWMAIIPGLLITLTVLSLNFIGDGLRAKLNPRE